MDSIMFTIQTVAGVLIGMTLIAAIVFLIRYLVTKTKRDFHIMLILMNDYILSRYQKDIDQSLEGQ